MNNNQILLSLSNSPDIVRNYKLNYNSTVLNKEGDIIKNIGLNIIYPNRDAIIGSINIHNNNKNMMVGDEILYMNDTLINSLDDLVAFIHSNPDISVNITAERGNDTVSYPITILNKNEKAFSAYLIKLICQVM